MHTVHVQINIYYLIIKLLDNFKWSDRDYCNDRTMPAGVGWEGNA
mgnify:CR=1 FL=1